MAGKSQKRRWKTRYTMLAVVLVSTIIIGTIFGTRDGRMLGKAAVFYLSTSAVYSVYMLNHLQPCDNASTAYDAAQEYLLGYIPHAPIDYIFYNPFRSIAPTIYIKELGIGEGKKPWFFRSRIGLYPRYFKSGDCTFRFVGSMSLNGETGFERKSIRFQIRMQYIDGTWHKTFFRTAERGRRLDLEKWNNWVNEKDGAR